MGNSLKYIADNYDDDDDDDDVVRVTSEPAEQKPTYAIFRVLDYKGGELRYCYNIEDFSIGGYLADNFEYVDFDKPIKEMSEEDIKKVLKPYAKEIDEALYAGSNDIVLKVFRVKMGKMTEVSVVSMLPEIARYIKENWD